jgi:cytochrome c553
LRFQQQNHALDMKLLASLLTAAILAAAPAFPAFSAGEAPAASAQPKAAKVDLAKGEASYTAVCAACHAADGNSTVPIQPKLAGQHPEYLVKQLLEFKDDKRKDPVMKGFASMLSEPDMKNIAACAGYHSPNGAGIPAQYPRLAGQHADYTTTQLTAFRDGKRGNSIQMTQVAAKLNDREIKAVADYIAGLR